MMAQDSSLRVAVVGAGITGLTAAYRLQRLAHAEGIPLNVTVFESSTRAGGVIGSETHRGYVMEYGPDAVLSQKPQAIELIKELGLGADLIETNQLHRRSLVAWKGRLERLPDGFVMLAPSKLWPFFTSPLFSPAAKLRMVLDMVLPPNRSDEDETVESFVVRRFGRQVLERVAQPMVGGIYVGDVAKLSARSALSTFVELERQYGSVIRGLIEKQSRSQSGHGGASGARYSMFVTLKEGLGRLVDQLESAIGSDSIKKGMVASGLSRTARGSWQLTFDNQDCLEFDAVIFAIPAQSLSPILHQSDPGLATQLSGIRFASSAVVNLLYKKDDIPGELKAFGFVVPALENRSVLAVSAASNKFANRAPDGHVALRVFLGGVLQSSILEKTDDGILDIAQADLRYYLGVKRSPVMSHVMRFPSSMPQYDLGHSSRVFQLEEGVREKLPGIFLCGNSYHGVGIPDCVASAQKAAHAAIRFGREIRKVEPLATL